jgi:hypothetical protein
MRLNKRPAGFFRQIEDVVLLIEDIHINKRFFAIFDQCFAASFKLVADEF